MIRPLAAHFAAASKGRILGYLLGVFVLSRCVFLLNGVHYDMKLLTQGWQFLDVELLKRDLLRSVFYQHSQPPLFNLFLGLALKVAPQDYALVFQALFTLMGLSGYLLMFALMRRLGISRLLAFGLCVWYVVSPSAILYEQWLFYTLPLTLLLLLSAWTLLRFLDTEKTAWLICFCLTLFGLCGTQSTFHLLYFAFIGAALMRARRAQWRKIAIVAALPFLLVLAIYVKNEIVFGQFTASSWLGMNTAINRIDYAPLPERERLIDEGEISPVSLTEPFSTLDQYPAEYSGVPAKFAAIPALAQSVKSSGDQNYNHYGYIEISRHYGQDTRYILAHNSRALIRGGAKGWVQYFCSSSDYLFFYEETEKTPLLRMENTLYDHVFYGRIPRHGVCLFLLIGLPLLVIYAFRAARSQKNSLDETQRILLLYLAFTILYVALVGNTLNATENNRIRFMTDPFALVLLGFALNSGIRCWVLGVRSMRRTN